VSEALRLLSQLSAKVPEYRQQIIERPKLVDRTVTAVRFSISNIGSEQTSNPQPLTHTRVCFNGLALLHNLALAGHHRTILIEHGAKELAQLCSCVESSDDVQVAAVRLQNLLEQRGTNSPGHESEGGVFSGVFAVRGAPCAATLCPARNSISKRQRRKAQRIAQSILKRSKCSSSNDFSSSRSQESMSPRRGEPRMSSLTCGANAQLPPLEGYGCRGRGGWRIHAEHPDWLWNESRGVFF